MRTTVDLPQAVFRAAKARAARRGESLKSLLTRAVSAELGSPDLPPPAGRRMVLPVFGTRLGPPVRLSNADLERALSSDETERVPTRSRPRRTRTRRRS